MSIPQSLGEFTPAWFNTYCQFGGTVSGASAVRIGEGVGLLGQLARVELTYATGDGPSSVVVKIASAIDAMVQMATQYGFYDREVSFYREAASQLDNVPHCYFANMHESTAPFVIVMEDMSAHRMVDQVAGCGADDAHAIMRAAAKVHAKYWANDALDSLTWLPPVNNPLYKAAEGQYNALYDGFLERYGDGLSPYGRQVADALRTSIGAMQDQWFETRPLTLAHYDLRLDNVLFGRGDDTNVYLIDWQLSAKQFGAFDVAYFIGWSMTDDVRRAITPSLITAYHDELVARGVPNYSRQTCEDDVRRGMLGVATMGVVGSMAVPAENERAQQLLDAYAQRSFAACDDLRPLEFLP
jgi:hypothetical protein